MEKKYYDKFHGSKVEEVIVTTVCEGEGTEERPFVEVKYYANMDGRLLFRDGKKY